MVRHRTGWWTAALRFVQAETLSCALPGITAHNLPQPSLEVSDLHLRRRDPVSSGVLCVSAWVVFSCVFAGISTAFVQRRGVDCSLLSGCSAC
mmetsp:Transcript_83263/g.222591  ORF Transcript_83263/g.222591 Transcript_83263/m.222591 type:complete len:93 (-) Transcript_83263:8-286(-)